MCYLDSCFAHCFSSNLFCLELTFILIHIIYYNYTYHTVLIIQCTFSDKIPRHLSLVVVDEHF